MFTTKKSQLFEAPKKVTKSASQVTNSFVQNALKDSAITVSGNGAKKYKTTGNPFVDQFGVIGSYKEPRSFTDIAGDCETLWASDKHKSVLFAYYLRTINRVVQLPDGTQTSVPQLGGEMKHESIMRMIWLSQKDSRYFWDNIGLFVSVGSWKDIIVMLQYDLIYNGWDDRKLDWNKFGSLLLSGLANDNTLNLLKKYLPQIKSNKYCTTVESQADNLIGKWICSLLFGNKGEEKGATYKQYRKLKSSGTAHQWQQLISKGQHDLVDFSTIHGRALSLLVKGKYLKNQNLTEKYAEWVKRDDVEVKFTGFVHELFSTCKSYHVLSAMPPHEQDTVNKQFATLLSKGLDNEQSKLIVVRDTSGSMGSIATGTNMSCGDIGKALALYFSEYLTGEFANSWIEFNSDAEMHVWKGETPLAKWYNDHSSYVGSTDFQSVIELFCRMKQQGVPEEAYPKGILCISDAEFNPSHLDETNVETARKTLLLGGFSQEYVDSFVIVLWNLQSDYYGSSTGKKFETYGDVENVFYFSGYSASVISFLTGKIKNAAELLDAALDQEILNMVH